MFENNFSVGIYTLGCKVNQYESEAIAEELKNKGFTVKSHDEKCDIYIINTCTVTAESDRKARQFIRRAIKSNPDAYIIATGCLAQTNPDQIAKIKGVDRICGNSFKLSVVNAALEFAQNQTKYENPLIECYDIYDADFEQMSISHFDRTRAYVKIEDGCENRCTYCIIPKARGLVRSKDPAKVIEEVTYLTEHGCKEIVLTGIETASYGKDLGNIDLADLLCKVDKIKNIGRVRLGSLDPSLMSEKFVSKIANLKSLTPHFHLSLQSGSSSILASMKRKYNAKMAFDVMERVRKAIPNVMFTTDIIVGFPGETEENFMETMDFVKRARFLNAHIFTYSKRKGTPAAEMDNQIDEKIKNQRSARLIALQNDITAEILSDFAKKKEIVSVLFETYTDGIAFGHTDSFIEVEVKSDTPLHSLVRKVKITDSNKTHCIGEIITEKD